MRGRSQALGVAVISAGFPFLYWLSAAIVALVTLRKGPGDGAYLLAWAVLPAAFLLGVRGDPVPLIVILGTAGLAMILRWTVSWQLTLCAGSVLGVVTGLGMLLLGVNFLQEVEAGFAEIFANLSEQLAQQGGQPVTLTPPGIVSIAGMLGIVNAISGILCLLLARWWQSTLYNPGGFRAEFHGLRYTPAVGGILVLLVLGVSSLGLEYRPWAVLFALPLSIAGLGLVHARAAYRGYGSGYLTLFYLLWVFLDPVKLIVMGLAVADSLVDFRSRWQRKPDQEDSDNE